MNVKTCSSEQYPSSLAQLDSRKLTNQENSHTDDEREITGVEIRSESDWKKMANYFKEGYNVVGNLKYIINPSLNSYDPDMVNCVGSHLRGFINGVGGIMECVYENDPSMVMLLHNEDGFVSDETKNQKIEKFGWDK